MKPSSFIIPLIAAMFALLVKNINAYVLKKPVCRNFGYNQASWHGLLLPWSYRLITVTLVV